MRQNPNTFKYYSAYFIIFNLELYIQIRIIRQSYEGSNITIFEYVPIQYNAMYLMILSLFEFVSVTKYLLLLQMEGLIQLFPLKIFKYFAIWVGFIFEKNYINRLVFFALDIVTILGIIKIHNTTLSCVYHDYNMKIGSDTRIRNAYIIRNFFAMSRFFYVTLSMFQIFVFMTYGRINWYKIYVIVKFTMLLVDYFIYAIASYEDRKTKILSLCIYFTFALSGIYIVVETIVFKK